MAQEGPAHRLVQATEPSWLGTLWGRSWGAPAVGCGNTGRMDVLMGLGEVNGEACLSLPVSLAKTGKYRISNQSMLSIHLSPPPSPPGKWKLVVYVLESIPKYV